MAYRKEIQGIPENGVRKIRTTEHGHAFTNTTVDPKLPDSAPTGESLASLLNQIRKTPKCRKIQNPRRLQKISVV